MPAAHAEPSVFVEPLPRSGSEWRTLREHQGWSVEQVARRAGVVRTTVWRLEHDRPVSRRVKLLVGHALGPSKPAPTLFEEDR